MLESDLDAWLPECAVRTHHARDARADPDALWDAARGVQVCDARRIGRVVRWRIPGTPATATFHETLGRYPFTVLEQGARHSISGLCGRIWTLARDYPKLSGPDEFRAWDERGTVRVLIANWVEPLDDGGSRLVSEARVQPVDRRASLRLRALWRIISPFERFVGAEALALAARRAEDG